MLDGPSCKTRLKRCWRGWSAGAILSRGRGSSSCSRRWCFTGHVASACRTPTPRKRFKTCFVILLKRLRTFEYQPDKSFRAWLATVTRHEALRRLRQPASGELASNELPAFAASDDDGSLTDEREYAAWLTQRAARIIERDFDPATWQAFRKYVLHGRPAADVALELGVSRNAVYLSTHRVVKRLREELAGVLD